MVLRRVLMVIAVLFVFYIGWLTAMVKAQPGEVAVDFLHALAAGEVDKAKQMLESHEWRSGPPEWAGGDDAYFRYESSYEPNLAFLHKQPFTMEKPRMIRHYPSSMCLLPLYCSESASVEVKLTFDAESTRPFLLPPALAFGGYNSPSEAELYRFAKNPLDFGDDGFTLRIRPTLNAGLIQPPPVREITPPPMPSANSAMPLPAPVIMRMETPMGGLMPRAVDVKPIIDAKTGQPLSLQAFEAHLPRVQSVTMAFYLSRHTQLEPWKISIFALKDATVLSQGKAFIFSITPKPFQ